MNQLGNKLNANAIIQLFSGIELHMSSCIHKNVLHGTIAMSM